MLTMMLVIVLRPEVTDLQKLPDVASVEVVTAVQPPQRRVIHLLDWHYVEKDKFAIDLGLHDEKKISEAHQEHIQVVEAVQDELRQVIQTLSVEQVFMEGVTPKNLPQFQARLDALRKFKPRADSPIALLLAEEYRHDLLRLGGAGQLAMEERIKVLPAEEHEAYIKANPVIDGKLKPNDDANARREEAVIRMLLKGPPVTLLVFGGAHDFRDEIARLAPDCEYVRVTVKSYPQN